MLFEIKFKGAIGDPAIIKSTDLESVFLIFIKAPISHLLRYNNFLVYLLISSEKNFLVK